MKRIRNLDDLNRRIEELTNSAQASIEKVEEKVEEKVNLADSIGDGLMIGQMVFSIFGLFQKYNLPPKNKFYRIGIAAALVAGYKYLQHHWDNLLSEEE